MSTFWPYVSADSGGELESLKEKVEGINNKVTNLGNITLKNNISDQRASGLRISKSPTDIEDVVRLYDIRFKRIINHEGDSPKNSDLIFTMRSGEIQVNKTYALVGVLAIDNIDYTFNTTLFMSGNNNYNHRCELSNLPTSDDLLSNNIVLGIRYQSGKFYIRWNGSFTGRVNRITVYYRELPHINA